MLTGIADFLVRMLPGVILGALLYVCLLPARRQRLLRSGLSSSLCREVMLCLYFLFCGGLALITLTPRWFHWLDILTDGFPGPFFQTGTFNLTPLATLASDPWSVMILLGNVIMFFPIGFFFVLLWRGQTWKQTLLLGFIITLCIEVFQLLIGRAFDVDDLLLNTLGVLLGGLFCRLLRRFLPILYLFQVQDT